MAGVADHPQKAEIEKLWRQGYRAKAIVDWLEENNYEPIKVTTLARYGQRYFGDEVTMEDEVTDDDEGIASVRDLIERIEAAGIGTVKDVTLGTKTYPGWARPDPTGPAVSVQNNSLVRTIKVTPKSPLESHIERSQRTSISLSYSKAKYVGKEDGWKVGIFLPDPQIGFFQNNDGTHTSTHDEAALDVAHQIVNAIEQMYGVDLIVNAGDGLDLPAFGVHRSAPGFLGTTQLAINRASEEAAIQRKLAPNSQIIWIEGNHEVRLTNYLVDKATPLLGLTRADEDKPIISIPYLCRFDDYQVDYIGPYPDGEFWVNDHLRFEHGSTYSSALGGTAVKQLQNGISVGYGHIHRSELLYKTRHTHAGPRTHFAGSPGCLCKTDSSIPASGVGINAEGSQGKSGRASNWDQGLWVFWWQDADDQLTALEPIQIWSGWAMFRGQSYFATVGPNGEELQ